MIAIVNEGRLVGCELEMYGLVDRDQLLSVLQRCNIRSTMAGYSGNASGELHVAIKTDGSINPDRNSGLSYNGYELTWRMYANSTGYEFTKKLCGILVQLGMRVNSSCGFHVHVDGHDSTLEHMKSLYNLCYKYENIIGGFIPPSSRGRDYAKMRNDGDRQLLVRARSISQVMTQAHDRRYGLNLSSYGKDDRKTIEFRYHSPTVDGDKVWNWCLLCSRLYEHAKARQCTSKGKLPNTPANLRNFLCAIGLKPNNKIYTSIDTRLKVVRDYLIVRWWKFERATRAEVARRRAAGRARASRESTICATCARRGFLSGGDNTCMDAPCTNGERYQAESERS